MQTIGLIGGMSWESSLVYYRDLNVGVQERLGGLSSPKLVLSTVDFAELTHLEDDEKWDQIGTLLADAATGVERAGADFLHAVHDDLPQGRRPGRRGGRHPAAAPRRRGLRRLHAPAGMDKVAFIGTTVAMNDPFFISRIADGGPEVIVPDARHHEWLNDAIYGELVHGRIVDRTRRRVVALIDELWDAGAGGVLLGCTELELLIRQADTELPVFPCTTLHVQAALDRALA